MKKGKTASVSGILNGYIRVFGKLDNPSFDGKVKLENGKILGVPFDLAIYELIGTGTIIDLKNSRLIRGDYQTLIEGYIDLKLPNIFEHVKYYSDEKSAYLAGFNIERSEHDDEFTFTRGLVDRWNLRFRTSTDEASSMGDGKEREAELELEYELDENKNIFFRIEEDEGAFGIKRKYKF
jgi:hypothetical protein